MIAMLAVMAMAVAPVQGGQGGSGFGGGGSGFGGGGAGAAGAQGGQMGNFGEETTYNHILTPGDRTDWPFKVKAGEVLILRAQSTSFDPAIEVEDADHKKIGENDDEELGKQDALLLVYFEKEGTYTAHVKNYRSTAGGAYTFTARRFQTTTVEPDKSVDVQGNGEYVFLRIPARKGQVITLGSSSSASFGLPLGPDGKQTEWLKLYGGRLGNSFRATLDGGYYVRTWAGTDEGAKTKFSAYAARTHVVGQGPQAVADKNPGLDIWTVKAKAGEFVTFKAEAKNRIAVQMAALPDSPEDKPQQADSRAFQVIGNGGKWMRGTTVMFFKEGEYEMVVDPRRQAYDFSVAQAWKPWDGLSDFEGDLPIGATMYYGFDAKPGHIVHMAGTARTFDLQVECVDSKWEPEYRFDDSADSSNPAGTVLLPNGGRHYLVVQCVGNGGGGPYKIAATPIKAQTIKLGETKEATMASPLDGLWTIAIDKLQTLSLRLKGPSEDISLSDAEGKTISPRSVMIKENDWMLYFDIKKPGTYRIWREFSGTPEKLTMRFETVVD